jgi:hypothetical protein
MDDKELLNHVEQEMFHAMLGSVAVLDDLGYTDFDAASWSVPFRADQIARLQARYKKWKAAYDDKGKGEHMTGFKSKQAAAQTKLTDDDDIQDYKREWVGLTGEEKALVASVSVDVHDAVHRTEAKLKQKNMAKS